MAKELVWFEVLDLTCQGLRNPEKNYWLDDYVTPCPTVIGEYSSKEKAVTRLRKWAEEKGIDFDKYCYEILEETIVPYYESCGGLVACYPIMSAGLYYDLDDNLVPREKNYAYQTSARIVRKVMTLDLDEDMG